MNFSDNKFTAENFRSQVSPCSQAVVKLDNAQIQDYGKVRLSF